MVDDALSVLVNVLDPDAVPLFDSPDLWSAFDAIERRASAAKTLLARRVADSCTWQRAGYRSAAEQLAGLSDSSVGSSTTMLETSRNVEDLPATAAVLRSGTLSRAKAEVVVSAAAVAPDARLLASAATTSYGQLRKECLRAKGKDVDAAHARIHRDRYARMHVDDEGAWNLHARGTVDDGRAFKTALDALIDARFKVKTDEADREPREAYAFDALIELARRAAGNVDGPQVKPAPRNIGVIRVDHSALARGWVEGDEICEIAGLGPIPVRVAREQLGDAILQLVLTKGVDVANVTHLGRGVTAAQRAALRWLMAECTNENCTRTERLENDHRKQWTDVHETRLDNIDPLCEHDHDLKTRCGWALVEGQGKRPLVAPDDPRHPNYRPPPEAE